MLLDFEEGLLCVLLENLILMCQRRQDLWMPSDNSYCTIIIMCVLYCYCTSIVVGVVCMREREV